MTNEILLIIAFVTATLGGIAASSLGYLESGKKFDGRKFTASLMRAVTAGVVFTVTFNFAPDIGLLSVAFISFIGGAGVDVLGNRAAGTVKTKPGPS